MSLQRLPDWPERLDRIIASAAELPFEWGRFDCALHVCNCIRAIVDVDPAASYRGKYSDEAGAAAIFAPNFEQFIAGICSNLGFEETPVTYARRGDVVFLENGTEQGAIGAISTDGRFASCASDKGLVLVGMRRWKRAWRVG